MCLADILSKTQARIRVSSQRWRIELIERALNATVASGEVSSLPEVETTQTINSLAKTIQLSVDELFCSLSNDSHVWFWISSCIKRPISDNALLLLPTTQKSAFAGPCRQNRPRLNRHVRQWRRGIRLHCAGGSKFDRCKQRRVHSLWAALVRAAQSVTLAEPFQRRQRQQQ